MYKNIVMHFFKFFLIICFTGVTLTSQSQHTTTDKQAKQLKELIEIKKELTNSDQLKEFYRIQLYSGSLKEAESLKKDFDTEFEISSTIKYESPYYKVWVGNYRTRLEADRAMLLINEAFENAFIIKPGRN
ncbi:hypothetical protein GCM10010831_02750 [Psychroflexus salis]|uniref:SPOR domain-containing protein n=2 Tax=Psychroflexus salis TaxID=1526574 RepID=A0A916ZN93_9FLAO|nr:hypothetical protein GCM10010831_02750 [Psychroflexus salis]